MSIDSAEQNEPVLAERRGSVLLLTLNRPDRLNAWNDELEQRYFDLLAEADEDPAVRAVVVTGSGRGFCAGADMQDLDDVSQIEDVAAPERERPRSFPMRTRKPLLAAINGAAAGLGLVEALYCDLRFSTPAAKLTTAFVRRGLIAEYGMAWLLPRLVGPGNALDLLLSGRVINGEEAQGIGLVERVAKPDQLVSTAIDYAADLAAYSSPTSMSVIKQQVYRAMEIDFDTAEAEAEQLMVQSFHEPDAREGVQSYLENRSPEFRPLGPE